MPTVTYRFKLPDDEYELKVHQKAYSMSGVLSDFSTWLRGEVKYADDKVPEAVMAERERIKEKWWAMLGEYDVDPWEL